MVKLVFDPATNRNLTVEDIAGILSMVEKAILEARRLADFWMTNAELNIDGSAEKLKVALDTIEEGYVLREHYGGLMQKLGY